MFRVYDKVPFRYDLNVLYPWLNILVPVLTYCLVQKRAIDFHLDNNGFEMGSIQRVLN